MEGLRGVLGDEITDKQSIELSKDRLAYWREVVLLAVGYLVHSPLRDTGKPRLLTEELCPERAPQTDQGWRKVWLAGAVLREVGVNRVRDTEQGKRLLATRLTELLEQGALSARERAEAGDVLGELGDPRFDPNFFYLPCRYRDELEPLYGFVEIPAGPFVMGEGDEKQELSIDYPYWIARYPVTVAQFSAFMDAGGYETKAWWTETGWEWREGRWDSQVKVNILRDWLKNRPAKLRGKPMGWSEQRAVGNRPVVGVSWFEALAYCRWLDARLRGSGKPEVLQDGKSILRLPTEAEWERAGTRWRCASLSVG